MDPSNAASATINHALAEAGVLERWDQLTQRIAAGETDAALGALPKQVLQEAFDLTKPLAQAHLSELTKALGTQLSAGRKGDFQALVLAADSDWRQFHAQLNPAAQHVVSAEAMKEGLKAQFPSVYILGWGDQ